jgi:4-alpha-glucanotransferase
VKTSTRGLGELAKLFGIQASYEDMSGEQRKADPEAVMLTLQALGAHVGDGTSPTDALRARRAELDALQVQPVHVAWEGRLREVRIRLDRDDAEQTAVELRLEDGTVVSTPCTAQPVPRRARAGWTATHALHLDRHLPLGHHRMQIETAGATFDTLVIAAPRHAHVPADGSRWGMFVPLYAICSSRSWGIGDYSDLRRTSGWAGELGAGFVSTLPLLATFLDAPFEPSPYSPASRLFWNEIFVDVQAVPGWSEAASDADPQDRTCATNRLVDYRRTAALKRRELERALREVGRDAGVQAELQQFAAASARVDDYCRFRAVCDRRREGWPVWPERMRDGLIRDGDFAPEDYAYHLFAQWQADRQLAGVASAARDGAAALYLDMPLGVNPDGYDSWRFRELFSQSASAGAPPDPLFTGGQDWGFRPLIPDALRRSGYRYLIEVFRHHLRHARMLRLDHVMSLYRLFWIPQGVDAKQGVYVRYPDEELFAVLVLESARHQAAVIGEDLGTVPPAVRKAMDRHRVHRMHVVQFEASPDADPPVPPAPEPVVASLNTHDMPTFAGFWRGSEIDDQLDLGLIDEEEHRASMERRAKLRLRIARMLGAGGEIDAALARQRLLERLSASHARYLLINLEDLWLEERPQNVPGTSTERPNWQRRARRGLDEIMQDAAIRRMLKSIGDRRSAAPATDTDHG